MPTWYARSAGNAIATLSGETEALVDAWRAAIDAAGDFVRADYSHIVYGVDDGTGPADCYLNPAHANGRNVDPQATLAALDDSLAAHLRQLGEQAP